jgi:hypothetical protein
MVPPVRVDRQEQLALNRDIPTKPTQPETIAVSGRSGRIMGRQDIRH